MTARITPLDPVKGRFLLTRAAEQLAKAERAHRKGASIAEARRALIRTQARFLAHDIAANRQRLTLRKGADVGRSDSQINLFEVKI
jgi:hypothetical protein